MPTREELIRKYGRCTARAPWCTRPALHLGPCESEAQYQQRLAEYERKKAEREQASK